MADLTITAANVKQSTGAQRSSGTAGEAITAGQCVYLNSADGKLYKADANVSAAAASVVGLALHAASTDQPIAYQTGGNCSIGATVAVGQVYCVSATAGGIAPYADLVTNDWVSIIGYGATTATLTIDLNPTGIQKA